MYQLLSATPSPFARKVRMVLHEKGIPFELVTEVPWNNDATAASVNPLGKVPVLMRDDGERFFESSYIVEYLELTHPEVPMIPAEPDARLLHRRLEVLADGLCDALVLALIEGTRDVNKQSDVWIARQTAKAERALAEMASLVSEADPWISGEQFGLGDICVASALGYIDLRFPRIDWRTHHPEMHPLFDRLSGRDSFEKTVPTAQTISDVVA